MKANHLDYYRYQAEARQIHTAVDVAEVARQKSYLYDQIVLPRLKSRQGQRIVEAACGHGSFLYWLQNRGFDKILGVDSSTEQTALAQSAGLNIETTEINQWLDAQQSESIHVIVGIDLIEHLPKDDLVAFLQNSHRVLQKGGLLILRYPNGDSPLVGMNLFNDITHIWTYTTTAMRSLSEMCGYANAEFNDESAAAIRDHRWLKVPLCKFSQKILGALFQAATREKIGFWSPHIWVFLTKK